MPRRLAFFYALQLFLSTSAFAHSQNAVPPARMLWDPQESISYFVEKWLAARILFCQTAFRNVGDRSKS